VPEDTQQQLPNEGDESAKEPGAWYHPDPFWFDPEDDDDSDDDE